MDSRPGFRFYPTDQELINFYLFNKNLGNTELVDDIIPEIDVYNCHPTSLPSLSRPDNGIHYFFAPKKYTTRNKRKRSTDFWCWERSGEVRDIKDKCGTKIGDRGCFVFKDQKAPKVKGKKSLWVMHEYNLPQDNTQIPLQQTSYVICKVFDKRNEATISYGSNSSEPVSDSTRASNTQSSQPLVFDPIVQPQAQIEVTPLSEQLGEEQCFDWTEEDLSALLNEEQRVVLDPIVQPQATQNDEEFLGGLSHIDQS